jgi:ABC-type phosphate/phosphonate transport system substrate-binding protein
MKIFTRAICGCTVGTLGTGFLLLIGVSAGQVAPPNEPRAVTASDPFKLTLVVSDVYCKDSACSCVHFIATRCYVDFFQLLKARYNIQVTPVYLEDSFQTARQIKSGQVDGAICKPWLGYQSAQASGRHYRRAADLQDVFTNTVLKGLFIVLADSPIRTLKDAANKRIVFGKADAYEKHQAAFVALEKAGLALPPLSSRLEKSSCIEAIGSIMDKSAEVAVVSHYALTGGCAVDIAKPEDFRVVAETEPLPFISLMLDQDKISKADFSRIREAFIALSREALPSTMSGGGFVEPLPWKLVDGP